MYTFYQNCSDLLITQNNDNTVGVQKDETSLKFLYFRSVLGNGSTPFLIKGASGQLSCWVRDSRRVELETRRREEVTSKIGTKRLLTCAVDRSTKRIISSNSQDYFCYYYYYHWEQKHWKSYSNKKGLKRSHLSPLMTLHEVFFCFVETFKFCHENCIYYIYSWCYIFINFCPSIIGSTWSYLFSVNPILTQQACSWTNGELSEFYDDI